MSQAGIISTTAGPVPPTVPTSFVTQSGTAVPAANILLVNAYDTTENNVNGIETKGGVAAGDPPGTGATNELDVYLTNRITGTITTVNATPVAIATFPLGATPAVFTFDVQIASFNTTDINGDGYFISGSARTNGVIANLCGTPDKIVNEEVEDSADANMVVSGNNVVFQATGIGGKVHRWNVVATYVEVT